MTPKRLLDVLLAGSGLVVSAPLWGLIALAVKLEEQMSKTDVDWQVCVYGGALHAFTNPGANIEGMAYHAAADRRSWQAMLALFDEIFQPAREG